VSEPPAALARRVQPLWAAVPVSARAAVLRRAAQAVLDEVDTLAGLLAAQTGRPRTALMLGELLPSVSGLHGLAAAAPDAVRERRAGRSGRLVPAPIGVVGLRGGTSPWAEPLLETAAAVVMATRS
jgi:acyl-CoA reductase-like NAD-dependent aldehyde dehydrogenase